MQNNLTNVVLIIMSVVLLFSIKGCIGANSRFDEGQDLIEALNDEMVTWKGKDSLNHSKIKIIETARASSFLDLNIKDSVIAELQEEVRKYKHKIKHQGSVTVLNTVTKFDTTFLYRDYPEECYFQESILNPYIDATFGFSASDTLFFSLKVFNKFTIVIGEEKEGLFKRKPYVEIVNHNPYTDTKTVRTYQTLQKKKHFSIGPQVGVGLTSDLKVRPYIGFGLQYSLFKF